MRLFILESQNLDAVLQPDTGIPLTAVMSPVIKPSMGRYVKVDVPTLVGKLYLSPFMGVWFRDAIEKTLNKIQPELVDRIVMSSILDR